jgi:hypothetical protein
LSSAVRFNLLFPVFAALVYTNPAQAQGLSVLLFESKPPGDTENNLYRREADTIQSVGNIQRK